MEATKKKIIKRQSIGIKELIIRKPTLWNGFYRAANLVTIYQDYLRDPEKLAYWKEKLKEYTERLRNLDDGLLTPEEKKHIIWSYTPKNN